MLCSTSRKKEKKKISSCPEFSVYGIPAENNGNFDKQCVFLKKKSGEF